MSEGRVSPGNRRSEQFEVAPEHLATNWANDLPVLATPVVLWWTELVAMNMLAPTLARGEMTVGSGHDRVQHLAPTGIGRPVQVEAILTEIDNGRFTFEVLASDPAGIIYRGIHMRAVVAKERMLDALRKRGT